LNHNRLKGEELVENLRRNLGSGLDLCCCLREERMKWRLGKEMRGGKERGNSYREAIPGAIIFVTLKTELILISIMDWFSEESLSMNGTGML